MTAAKEELHVFSLAAFRLFDEKPRLGHQLSTAVLYPGIGSINSSTTTGIAASLYDFRGGPRCTVLYVFCIVTDNYGAVLAMRCITKPWRGEETLARVFWFYFTPLSTLLAVVAVIFWDTSESALRVRLIGYLWSVHMLNEKTLIVFMCCVVIAVFWVLNSLWECAPNSRQMGWGAFVRAGVAVTMFGVIPALYFLWLLMDWSLEEQTCLAREAEKRHVDLKSFTQQHYKEAFAVCVKNPIFGSFQ